MLASKENSLILSSALYERVSYLEEKYENIYNYKEDSIDERLILLSETMPLFSNADKKEFLRLIREILSKLPLDKSLIIVKLLLNCYFLDASENQILYIENALILFQSMYREVSDIILKMIMVEDESYAHQIIDVINSRTLDVPQSTAFNKIILDKYEGVEIYKEAQSGAKRISLKQDFTFCDHQIIIIIPPFLSRDGFLQPPIDAINTAKALLDKGYDVTILDMRVRPKPLYLYKISCDIAIVALCTYDIIQNYPVDYKYENAVYVVNSLKERDSIGKVIAYGPYFDSNLDAVLKICHPDSYVLGPIDENIDALINDIKEEQSTMILKKSNHREFVNLKNYYCFTHGELVSPWIAIYLNRGCPFHCSFCYKHFGTEVKYSSINKVINQLKDLRSNHGIKELFFLDSTFTLNREWTTQFCREKIISGLDVKWQAETRIDCFDKDLLALMQQAGCTKLFIGVESFNDDILKKCNKRINLAKIIDKIEILNQSHIDYEIFLVSGLPGESFNNIIQVHDIAQKNGIKSMQLVTFMPRPKTKFYDEALKQYPFIKEDFRYLSVVRSLVYNNIKRSDLRMFIEGYYENK
ncbi:MAG: B12-binding domain-containing radical SAM protein [Bacteroidales bacterium]|nr:B12-binding domain-containing radical SAM protein [Bacteroidales bacterium]